jgi:hypothetical protein
MSGAAAFLQKLKSRNNVVCGVQETHVDDAEGYRIAVIERGFLQEPVDRLGIRLSEDAQVISVDNDGPCKAVPPHYFVVSVNDQFVASSKSFAEEAQKELRLAVKLYNGTAMEELLARIMNANDDDDEGSYFNAKALFESTPRYAFLDGSHPMFMRWNSRYNAVVESKKALLAFQEQAQDQATQQSLRELQRTVEQAAEEDARAEAEALRRQQQADETRRQLQSAPKLEDVVLRETLFATSGGSHQGISLFDDNDDPASPTLGLTQVGLTATIESANDDAAISTEELLRIVSGGGEPSASTPDGPTPNIDELRSIIGAFSDPASSLPSYFETTEVTLLHRCRQEYVLADGTKVQAVVKERRGAKPQPPPEAPPRRQSLAAYHSRDEGGRQRIPNGASSSDARNVEPVMQCKYCKSTEHLVGNCHIKRAEANNRFVEEESERLKKLRERQVCRDFQRGHCARRPCPFLHEDRNDERQRKRTRSDDRRRHDDSPRTRSDDRRRHDDSPVSRSHRRRSTSSDDRRRRTTSRDHNDKRRSDDRRRDEGKRDDIRRDEGRSREERRVDDRSRDVERRDDRRLSDRHDDRRPDDRRDDRRPDVRRDDRRPDVRRDDRRPDDRRDVRRPDDRRPDDRRDVRRPDDRRPDDRRDDRRPDDRRDDRRSTTRDRRNASPPQPPAEWSRGGGRRL